MRLTNGSTPYEGRLEVMYSGEWGTVCDNGFDLIDANVVCKELGYTSAERIATPGAFGFGSGPILLEDVDCNKFHTSILECPSSNNSCSHMNDVGIHCSGIYTECFT